MEIAQIITIIAAVVVVSYIPILCVIDGLKREIAQNEDYEKFLEEKIGALEEHIEDLLESDDDDEEEQEDPFIRILNDIARLPKPDFSAVAEVNKVVSKEHISCKDKVNNNADKIDNLDDRLAKVEAYLNIKA